MKYDQLTIKRTEDDPTEIDEDRLVTVDDNGGTVVDGDKWVLKYRNGGHYHRKAFYLQTDEYDWVLGRDNEDLLCLIPLKK